MGKSTRLKAELDDIAAILEIVSVLKDVSTNRFFTFAVRKQNYARFFELFVGFFQMLGQIETTCPLVRNTNPGVDLLVITSEQGFMSQLNGRVSAAALAEYNKNPGCRLICIGRRGAEKCAGLGMKVEKLFPSHDIDKYQLTVQIRDYMIERVLSGQTGRAVICYLWAKSFSILKPRVITLLPASELLTQAEGADVTDVPKDFIRETNPESIVLALADIWVHARVFEVVSDLQIVECAAQSQQLESAMEGLGSEKKSISVSFRKAGREELNGAMREVFTSTSMMKSKARRR